jgi:hypothetical protein
MPYLVRGFPLRKPLSALLAFIAELQGPRREQLSELFRRYGVTHESWCVRTIAGETWILEWLQIDDPNAAMPLYAADEEEFAVWYKTSIHELTGIDPNVAPRGAPMSELFAWEDDQRLPLAALG